MNEKSKANNLKVGFTIFFGIIIFFIFIILVGTNAFVFTKTFNLYINLDNTAGLVDGAPVTLGGYKIGDVEKVEFVVVNNISQIRIKLRIKSEYKNQIRQNTKVKVTSIGILGDKFVDLSIADPNSNIIVENSYLEVEPTLSLDNITKNISPGISSFNKIMNNLELVSDSIAKGKGTLGTLVNNSGTIQKVDKVISKLEIILNSFENNNGSLQKFLKDDSLYNDLAASAKEIKTIGKKLSDGNGTLGKLITNDSLYNNLNVATNKFKKLLTQTETEDTVVNGLLNDKKLYKNINDTINELNKLLADIKEHPEKYVNVSLF